METEDEEDTEEEREGRSKNLPSKLQVLNFRSQEQVLKK